MVSLLDLAEITEVSVWGNKRTCVGGTEGEGESESEGEWENVSVYKLNSRMV